MSKALVMAAIVVASSLASGCITFTVVSTVPRPDEYFVNGLDIETQHVKVEGIYPLTTAPAIPLPGITVGLDIWLGLNIAHGFEGAGDQATPTVAMAGLPMGYEQMDAFLAGTITAQEYAAYATPKIVEQILASPEYPAIEQRLMDAWARAKAEMSDEQLEAFRAGFKARFGYVPEDFTPAQIEQLLPAVVSTTITEGSFASIQDMFDAVRDITPAGFRFETGTWKIHDLVNAVRVLDAVHRSGDEQLIAQAQTIVARLVDDPAGTFTVEEVNAAFRELAQMQLPGEIQPEFVGMGNAYIGIFWYGVVFPFEEVHMYYRQIVLPFPLAIPGFGVIPRYTVTVATQIPPFDIEATQLRLDPLALPVTLPIYRAPLAAVASSGKEITFSTVVFNLGFEPGQAVISEVLPAGWSGAGRQGIVGVGGGSVCTGFPPRCTVNLPPLGYVLSTYTTEVPARERASLEILTTHIDSFDIDEGQSAGNGIAGDTSYNNRNEVITTLFGDMSALLFNAQTYIVTKPLDVILVEEPNLADAAKVAVGAYDAANAARAGTPAGGVERGSGLEGTVADPENAAPATANDALDGLVLQLQDTRGSLLTLLRGAGVDPIGAAEQSGAVDGDIEASVEEIEAARVPTSTPASPTADWAARVLGPGTRITPVSTAQELADVLAARILAIEAASRNPDPIGGIIAIADAIPSTVVVTTAAPGFGGSTVEFDVGGERVPVPAELLVDVLNFLGVGLVQDADGFASNPWLFSAAQGVVAGASADYGVTGDHGALVGQPVFALPAGGPRSIAGVTVAPAFRTDAAYGASIRGVWASSSNAAGVADVMMGTASGATWLAANDPTSAADRTYALNSALVTALLNFGDLAGRADALADDVVAHAAARDAAGLQADAMDGKELAQDAAGVKAVILPAGTPAVGSFELGYKQTIVVVVSGFRVPITVETDGRSTIIGPDVQTAGWDAVLKEAAQDSGFAFALSVPFGVTYPPVFG